MISGRLDIDQMLLGLALRRVGRAVTSGPNVWTVDEVTSTNDEAWARTGAGTTEADGFVVFAERQTRGRGRLGRRWESPRGASLLFSVLLVDSATPGDLRSGTYGSQLALLAAVACHDAIAEATGVQIEIKWPNDLLVGGRKLGGVLVESRPQAPGESMPSGAAQAHVVGIGINCLQQPAHFPPELRSRATSLDLVCSAAIDRSALARALLVHLDRWYADPSAWTGDDVRRAWLDRAAPLGTRLKLQHAGRCFAGHVIDLDPTASLLIQLDDGQRRLFDAANTTVLDE